MYFRTDVHMNAAGAQRAAHAVAAQAIALLGGQRGEQRFDVSAPTAPAPRMGDLLVLSGLKDAPEGWRPRTNPLPQTITPVRSGGLLDDTLPPRVLLAGSSNGLRSNFRRMAGQRSGSGGVEPQHGRRPVLRRDDQGAQAGSSWPQSLQLVIWEFSENTLSLPLTPTTKRRRSRRSPCRFCSGLHAGRVTHHAVQFLPLLLLFLPIALMGLLRRRPRQPQARGALAVHLVVHFLWLVEPAVRLLSCSIVFNYLAGLLILRSRDRPESSC